MTVKPDTPAIRVRGAKEHNLKNVNVDIPRNELVVITGLSGSGKSSLAFDTIYAEGQRRYVESLSAYARQFLDLQNKPDVESIEGLSPAIAIDQKTTSRNPRSTVGTVTEIYDYLRLLYARIGVPYSPATGKPIESQTVSQMVDRILALPADSKILLLAPVVRGRKGEHIREMLELQKQGYTRVKIDGEVYEIGDTPPLDKQKKHDISVVVDRLVVRAEMADDNRLADSLETSLRLGHGLTVIEFADESTGTPCLIAKDKGEGYDSGENLPEITFTKGEEILFSENFSCPESGFTIDEIEPRLFSFNSPYGACPACDGLGTELRFDEDLVLPDHSKGLDEGAIAPWAHSTSKFYRQTLQGLADQYNFSLYTPFNELDEDIQNIVMYGSGDDIVPIRYDDGMRVKISKKPFEGVIPSLQRRWAESDSNWVREELEKFQNITHCHACDGYRLKKEALCVKIAGQHVGFASSLTIEDAVAWFNDLPNHLSDTHNQIAEKVLKEIVNRLHFLNNVGLDYLTLSRESGTLSGGESQRIRLASQIGSGLTGVLYVLDEPSIGLHQCDNDRLLETLKHLRDLGNTVLVVEHDEDTMRTADYLIDMGPGAGRHGGLVIAEGLPQEVISNPDSITAQYLNGTKQIDIPQERRKARRGKEIRVIGAQANNLKQITAAIPLGTFCAVTGVSGGGKSSFVIETLYKAVTKKLHGSKVTPGKHERIEGLEYIDKVIEIDQSPIGRTPRSNPATYTGAFQPIRDWFTELPEAKSRGYKAGRFSFNVKGGRCEACQGDGLIKIEMHFLPDVYVQCDVCKGKRYNRETLEITYKQKSIADVLSMTVDEAVTFFANVPAIFEKLKALQEVGLGYVQIGQSATTLSGGEAQRVKLAKELSKRSTGRTLYILDEPTTGLHSEDISKLLKVLHALVDVGNTVVVIEHNLDVIKTADWMIDIGPQGGAKGGKIVATGTPESVIEVEASITGRYLATCMGRTKKNTEKKAA